jgi:hypothetical protein
VTLPRKVFLLWQFHFTTKGNFAGDSDLPWRVTITASAKEGNFAKDDNSTTKGGLAKDSILAKEGNVTMEGNFAG